MTRRRTCVIAALGAFIIAAVSLAAGSALHPRMASSLPPDTPLLKESAVEPELVQPVVGRLSEGLLAVTSWGQRVLPELHSGEAAASGSEAGNSGADPRGSGSTERPNVVLIQLESVRASATTPYNPDISTTPFLDRLADESLVADNAYTTVPHTAKSVVASNCGIEPAAHTLGSESASRGAIPVPCIAELLREKGYSLTSFKPAPAPSPPDVASPPGKSYLSENMGLKDPDGFPRSEMPTEGYEAASYFGYEDATMLEPSREFLEEKASAGQQPFLATYKSGTTHHPYYAPDRYGLRTFVDGDTEREETLDRYYNSVAYVDFFLEDLFRQYKQAGLYDNTVFFIYSDHGEAFGEHGRYQHDQVPYEEGIKVPLIVHDPRNEEWREGLRVERLASLMDILPTVVEAAGFGLSAAHEYTGRPLDALPARRTLFASCWNGSPDVSDDPLRRCGAAITSSGMKYIYKPGEEGEVYNLDRDPDETDNLGPDRPLVREYLARRYDSWLQEVEETYEAPPRDPPAAGEFE